MKIRKYRTVPEFLRRQAGDVARGRPRQGGIEIIGGADGPTAIFVATRRRRGFDGGSLLIRPHMPAILRSLGAAALLAGIAVSVYKYIRDDT